MAILDYGQNIMEGANWLADRASNVMMNQAPNRFLDYMQGTRGPVTDLTEIAPTRSTQDALMSGIVSNIGRKGYDFSNPFSSVIQSKGGGREHGLDRIVDYGGYKLGNPLKASYGTEVGQMFNTLFGGSAENQIANTLGDYTVNYTPKRDPNHPEVMNVSDIYDFRGKGGEGWGTPYDINVNLSPEMINKIKNARSRNQLMRNQLMNQKKQQMQQTIRQAEAAEAAKQKAAADAAAAKQVRQNIQTYGNRDRPNEGINAPGGGKGQSPTGGDVAGTPFVRGGYVDKALRGRSRYL